MIHYIEPFPVSEEILGAYLEGNLTAEESSMVQNIIETDNDFRCFVEEIYLVDTFEEETIYDVQPNISVDFELPEVPMQFGPQTNVMHLNSSIMGLECPDFVASACCTEEEKFEGEVETTLNRLFDVSTENNVEDVHNDVEENVFTNDNTEL